MSQIVTEHDQNTRLLQSLESVEQGLRDIQGIVHELRTKNKNLTSALREVCKTANNVVNGDAGTVTLENAIEWADEVINDNAVQLISFPDYLLRNLSVKKVSVDEVKLDTLVSIAEVIEIFKKWDQ